MNSIVHFSQIKNVMASFPLRGTKTLDTRRAGENGFSHRRTFILFASFLIYALVAIGLYSVLTSWMKIKPDFVMHLSTYHVVTESGESYSSTRELNISLPFRARTMDIEFVETEKKISNKTILIWNPFYEKKNWWFGNIGTEPFHTSRCPINTCVITKDKALQKKADAILFHLRNTPFGTIPKEHPPDQVWILMSMESPQHTRHGRTLRRFDHVFNWTASYKTSSDIYNMFGYKIPLPNTNDALRRPMRNMAEGKTKMALQLVSHCGTYNRRQRVVEALKKYIHVDVLGKCGQKHPCKRNGEKETPCIKNFYKRYKFYLGFENSLCKEYFTEKLWRGLHNNMLPILYGAPMEDYLKVAPPDSFLHLDNFTTIEELARYIRRLDANDEEYNKYFEWKSKYTIQYTEFEQFVCSVCAKLHTDPLVRKSVALSKWWDAQTDCKTGMYSWSKKQNFLRRIK